MNATDAPSPKYSGTFQSDLAFLQTHGKVLVLQSERGGRVVVSPDYQGRVMTSSVSEDGDSLGWIHRDFIEAAKTGTPFDNYGGEDRFWLGPEGGQFGLYFPAGKPFSLDTWQTPAAFQQGAWKVETSSPTEVSFLRPMTVANYGGQEFKLDVRRDISVLTQQAVVDHLGILLSDRVQWVAFESTNQVTNAGAEGWVDGKGLLSIWILGQFAPAADAKVIVPYQRAGTGPIVNDAYFGKVPADRLQIDEHDGVLIFTCDGNARGKIGLGPHRVTSVAGSYSASKNLLTIVQYDKPVDATRYVNSMWEVQKEPYAGDVLNSYNDGPSAPGKPSLGGFYELETSSPALALMPGRSATHVQRTFHFSGTIDDLSPIATKVLGVPLTKIVGK